MDILGFYYVELWQVVTPSTAESMNYLAGTMK